FHVTGVQTCALPICQQRRPVACVEAAYLGPGLPEDRVVGGDGQVAHQVQHVPAADGVARHHGDDRFGQIPDLPLEVQDVEARDLVVAHVPPVTPHLLVAAGAEGL